MQLKPGFKPIGVCRHPKVVEVLPLMAGIPYFQSEWFARNAQIRGFILAKGQVAEFNLLVAYIKGLYAKRQINRKQLIQAQSKRR